HQTVALAGTLDLGRRFPLKAGGLTRALPRPVKLTDETREHSMSTRRNIRAIERTAGYAGSAASLILGTLLLLIRP
ncbi:MAG: hypothetical protein WCF86_11510, partial [Pseudolabrys sp.]